MNAQIVVIPHKAQRYDTVGDWTFTPDAELVVNVSAMPDWRYEFLVGIHELIEAALCRHRGISEESVTVFDEKYNGSGEPGDHPDAPYRREHFFATSIERFLAVELDVYWDEYDAAVAEVGT